MFIKTNVSTVTETATKQIIPTNKHCFILRLDLVIRGAGQEKNGIFGGRVRVDCRTSRFTQKLHVLVFFLCGFFYNRFVY